MKKLTEKQKMLSGKPFYSRDDELVVDKNKSTAFLKKFNQLVNPYRIENKLKNYLGKIGKNVKVGTNFDATYGYNVFIGNHVSVNKGCRFLDAGKITIGDNCIIGPGVQIYAVSHPLDPKIRKNPNTRNLTIPKEVTIAENVWIGGSAIILGGIIVGKNSVIGAGAVVTKEVLPNSIVTGNPAKTIKELSSK